MHSTTLILVLDSTVELRYNPTLQLEDIPTVKARTRSKPGHSALSARYNLEGRLAREWVQSTHPAVFSEIVEKAAAISGLPRVRGKYKATVKVKETVAPPLQSNPAPKNFTGGVNG